MKIRKTLVAAWLATGAIAAVPVTLQAGETAQSTSSIAKITATGTVVDEEGEPMIGASVTEKGNPSNVVTTDLNGHYAIRVAPGSTLEITYVGYSLTAVKAGEDVHTVMKSASQDLSEVVVVGYGVQKKVNVVGSISTVDSKQLEGRTGGSVSNMINGYLSGVTITQSSGSPGSDQGTIRVRGVGSFGADPSPLILVDGLPGNMNDLTPAEIEHLGAQGCGIGSHLRLASRQRCDTCHHQKWSRGQDPRHLQRHRGLGARPTTCQSSPIHMNMPSFTIWL